MFEENPWHFDMSSAHDEQEAPSRPPRQAALIERQQSFIPHVTAMIEDTAGQAVDD